MTPTTHTGLPPNDEREIAACMERGALLLANSTVKEHTRIDPRTGNVIKVAQHERTGQAAEDASKAAKTPDDHERAEKLHTQAAMESEQAEDYKKAAYHKLQKDFHARARRMAKLRVPDLKPGEKPNLKEPDAFKNLFNEQAAANVRVMAYTRIDPRTGLAIHVTQHERADGDMMREHDTARSAATEPEVFAAHDASLDAYALSERAQREPQFHGRAAVAHQEAAKKQAVAGFEEYMERHTAKAKHHFAEALKFDASTPKLGGVKLYEFQQTNKDQNRTIRSKAIDRGSDD